MVDGPVDEYGIPVESADYEAANMILLLLVIVVGLGLSFFKVRADVRTARALERIAAVVERK